MFRERVSGHAMTNRNGEVLAGGSGSGSALDEDWETMLDSGQLDKSLDQLTVKPTAAVGSSSKQLPAVSGRNKKLPQIVASSSSNSSCSQPRSLLDDPFFGGPVRILTHDGNAARTQYRLPEPQLKILKRPTAENALAKKTAESQPGVIKGAVLNSWRPFC